MSVNFKALGGLLTFRYINDVEDMELDDLQEVYSEMEEEYNELEKDYKALKDELNKLKEVIYRKSPEEERRKIRKKPKTAKEVLGDEEIPYEVRMKYIIDAYRKDQEKWGKLAEYAKHLEAEVIRLKEILIANGYTDSGVVGDSKPGKVINDLNNQIQKLKGKINELKDLKDASNTIKNLENQISTFPLRTYKSIIFKEIIKSQDKYIKELQKLLDDNNIPYYPRIPVDGIEEEKIGDIVDDAVEYIVNHHKKQ